MFTIQYLNPVTGETAMQDVDTRSRMKLAVYLTNFHFEILAVYEQCTPITKAMQQEIGKLGQTMTLTKQARDFAHAFIKSPTLPAQTVRQS